MTSRFGKTYSRKGGEGTSKFDEVLSTKRGTLSTKWGATTYKAKVGSKRVSAPWNDSAPEVSKRPRPSGDPSEDPFGFDSDEESKPVSSRGGSKLSPAKPASAEPPQAERPGASLDVGSRSSFQGGSRTTVSDPGASWLVGNRNQSRLMEDTGRFLNSSGANTGNADHQIWVTLMKHLDGAFKSAIRFTWSTSRRFCVYSQFLPFYIEVLIKFET